MQLHKHQPKIASRERRLTSKGILNSRQPSNLPHLSSSNCRQILLHPPFSSEPLHLPALPISGGICPGWTLRCTPLLPVCLWRITGPSPEYLQSCFSLRIFTLYAELKTNGTRVMSLPAFLKPMDKHFECIRVSQGTGNPIVCQSPTQKKTHPYRGGWKYSHLFTSLSLISLARLIISIEHRECVILKPKCFQDSEVVECFFISQEKIFFGLEQGVGEFLLGRHCCPESYPVTICFKENAFCWRMNSASATLAFPQRLSARFASLWHWINWWSQIPGINLCMHVL